MSRRAFWDAGSVLAHSEQSADFGALVALPGGATRGHGTLARRVKEVGIVM